MSDLPLCACGEFYQAHHPECPARRAFEEALSRLSSVLSQLPEEMQDCTIRFKKCEVGHGRLTADNWIDNGCHQCRLEKTENQNRFLRSWIRELREDGADAVSVDPLYGMLLDRITELATADPAADSPEGIRLTALAGLCEAYEQRRGESAREPTEPDEDGHCRRCGLEFEAPAELTHECPPGFQDRAVERQDT